MAIEEDVGQGTVINFGASNFHTTFELLEVTGWEQSRESVETTHMGTTADKTYQPVDLVDPGTLSIRGHHDGALVYPIDGAIETITIDWAGQGGGAIWSASGFMSNVSVAAEMEGMMEFTADLKMTGAVSIV
jgi:hypothetical protein